MKMKEFNKLMPDDMIAILADEDITTIYFEGTANEIPGIYDNYTVVGTGISKDGEMLFRLSKQELS